MWTIFINRTSCPIKADLQLVQQQSRIYATVKWCVCVALCNDTGSTARTPSCLSDSWIRSVKRLIIHDSWGENISVFISNKVNFIILRENTI